MGDHGFNGRKLFYVENAAFENLSGTPSDAASGQMLEYFKSDHLYIKKPTVAEVMMPESAGDASAVSGQSLFKQKSTDAILEFYGLKAEAGAVNDTMVVTLNGDDIEIKVNAVTTSAGAGDEGKLILLDSSGKLDPSFYDLSDIDHHDLDGLDDDDHTQYALLAGRSGGQILEGGTDASDNLDLKSTDHGTKGYVGISDGSLERFNGSYRQEVDDTTADATPLLMETGGADWSLTPANDQMYMVKAWVTARSTEDPAEGFASYEIMCVVAEVDGTVSILGNVKQNFKEETSGFGPSDATFVVDSGALKVQVTGVAAEALNWRARIDWMAAY